MCWLPVGPVFSAHICRKIVELTGTKSQLAFKPLPADDPKQRQPDITYARKVIDWEPKIVLEDGLKKTIAYFDELLKGEP